MKYYIDHIWMQLYLVLVRNYRSQCKSFSWLRMNPAMKILGWSWLSQWIKDHLTKSGMPRCVENGHRNCMACSGLPTVALSLAMGLALACTTAVWLVEPWRCLPIESFILLQCNSWVNWWGTVLKRGLAAGQRSIYIQCGLLSSTDPRSKPLTTEGGTGLVLSFLVLDERVIQRQLSGKSWVANCQRTGKRPSDEPW